MLVGLDVVPLFAEALEHDPELQPEEFWRRFFAATAEAREIERLDQQLGTEPRDPQAMASLIEQRVRVAFKGDG